MEILNCDETAKYLNVKTATLYSWLSYKQLPKEIYRKLGRKPMFIKSEVEKWFLAGAELKPRKG